MVASPLATLPTHPRSVAVRRGLSQSWSSLQAHARRLTRDEVEARDLVQETALRALVFAWSFDPGTNVSAWLHTILRSMFITRCRRLARERRALGRIGVDPCAWVHSDGPPSTLELSPPVQMALSRLPEPFRAVVRLVDVEERSYRDAARELSLPLGTVMSRLHRGRKLLRALLAGPVARAA